MVNKQSALISFGVKYEFLFIVLIVLAAALITILMYYHKRSNQAFSPNQRILLMSLRFLSFLAIAFLLLAPHFQTLKKSTQKPLIITAWDNSESMITSGDSAMISEEINRIKDQLIQTIGPDFRLVNYAFGQEVNLEGEITFTEKKSDYGSLFSTLSNNHYNEKIGALILTGDGIYNQGRNPLNMPDIQNYPIFTIGIGDTTAIIDARIQDIRVNRTSFSGNRFPVEIDIVLTGLQDVPLKLSISEQKKQLSEVVVSAPGDDHFTTRKFLIEAGDPGLTQFKVEIEASQSERNIKNNQASFVVNVLEDKQKILILSAGPHPDIGAISNTLEHLKSYEVALFTEEPYPSDLSDYNLIILYQLPSAGNSIKGLQEPEKVKIPLLYVVGTNSFIPDFNSLNTGVTIEPLPGLPENAQPFINPSFETFTISEQFRAMVSGFPPLKSPFANYYPDPAISPVLYQRIKNVETQKPLLATGIINGRKTGFLFGEGIWQWRLHNYYTAQTHNQFNEIINQLVQYLAIKENEDNFMINYEPIYAETDNVLFTAEVYNDAFERVAGREITITISNEAGDTYNYIFNVGTNSYFLNAGKLPVGTYTFQAEVTLGTVTHRETGHFAVTEMNMEHTITKANHRMLYQLASQSGGTFNQMNQTDELIENLLNSNHIKPVISYSQIITAFLNQRWLFFVLTLLLSVEWFLRKYWGIY